MWLPICSDIWWHLTGHQGYQGKSGLRFAQFLVGFVYIRAIFVDSMPISRQAWPLHLRGLAVNFPKFFPGFGASWLDPLRVWYVLPMNMQWKAPWSWCRYPSYWKSAQSRISRGKSSCSTSFKYLSQNDSRSVLHCCAEFDHRRYELCVCIWVPGMISIRRPPRIWQATHQLVTSSYYCWRCGSRFRHQLFILCCMLSTNKGNVM